MTKRQFLGALREKLTGEISPAEVERNLQYYEKYIADRIKNGQTEAEILEELGSPLLIAKTIIDTHAQEGVYDVHEDRQDQAQDEARGSSFRIMHVDGWVLWLLLFLFLIIVLTILRVLLPILLPILLVCFFISILRR